MSLLPFDESLLHALPKMLWILLLEEDHKAVKAHLERIEKLVSMILSFYFPEYSYIKDDLLLQLMDEKAYDPEQTDIISEKLLINQANLKKEEIQNHIFMGDQFKWFIKKSSAQDKADLKRRRLSFQIRRWFQ